MFFSKFQLQYALLIKCSMDKCRRETLSSVVRRKFFELTHRLGSVGFILTVTAKALHLFSQFDGSPLPLIADVRGSRNLPISRWTKHGMGVTFVFAVL
jgi:hypothetical protein